MPHSLLILSLLSLKLCFKEELTKASLLRSPNLATCHNHLVGLSQIQVRRPTELEPAGVVRGSRYGITSSPSAADAPAQVPFIHRNKCELSSAHSMSTL